MASQLVTSLEQPLLDRPAAVVLDGQDGGKLKAGAAHEGGGQKQRKASLSHISNDATEPCLSQSQMSCSGSCVSGGLDGTFAI